MATRAAPPTIADVRARNATAKITATTMSTTVAELRGLLPCYGSSLFLRGLLSDITGEIADGHIRTGADNLVTTAWATHEPEQKETMRLMQGRKAIADRCMTWDMYE